jgi:hypothetical protein
MRQRQHLNAKATPGCELPLARLHLRRLAH